MQKLSNAPSSPSDLAASSASAAPVQELDSSLQLALSIIQAADDRKGGDITLLRVTEVSLLADYFVIVTGFSKVQVRAIANSIANTVEQECRRAPSHTEGMAEGSWVLQDYGDVIVHIQMPQEREFYNLEAFWGHAARVDYPSLLQQVQAS